jgi:uncharacterized phage protein (predicted DNA packaging)
MVVTLEEVKLYLRLDSDEEDTLITNFISAAQEICEDILRYPLSEFDEIPAVVRQALLYCVANMYEIREGSHYYLKNEGGGIEETVQVMKLMLSNLRRKEW